MINRRKKEKNKKSKRIFCIARDWCGAFAFFVVKQHGGMLSKKRFVKFLWLHCVTLEGTPPLKDCMFPVPAFYFFSFVINDPPPRL